MSRKLEILPPVRTVVAKPAVITSNVPAINTGGYIESALSERRWKYQSRAVDALARLNTSEAACRASQTQLVEQDIRFKEALFRHQELPERLGHERDVRRVERADAFRQVQHTYEIHEINRAKERALAETDLTHARAGLVHSDTVLIDAEQQRAAQREHGQLNYEITHKKKNLELLDIQLSEQERRALMKKQLEELEDPADEESNGTIEQEINELFMVHEELRASGLDTSRLDKVIAARRKR